MRRHVRSPIHALDGLVAAVVLASMVWATVFVLVFCIRASLSILRPLWSGARSSQFVAGMVTFGGLAFGLAGGLLLLGFGAAVAHKLDQESLVVSVKSAGLTDPAMERARSVLHELSEFKTGSKPMLAASTSSGGLPALAGTGGRRSGWTVPDSPLFAQCIDRLMKRDTAGDPIKVAARQLASRFYLSELDARGLVIDTLVSVCQQKATDPDELVGYFERSLRNAARNFRQRFLRDGKQCSIELVPAIRLEQDGDQIWEFTDRFTARQAFCDLPEMDQALIKERVLLGRSFVEIGDRYDMSENGAQKAFDRAMSRLTKLFEKN